MRITKLTLPAESNDNDGLKSITMTKLKPIVLLVGKNGAGKSRLLNKMFDHVTRGGVTEKGKEEVKKQINRISRTMREHESGFDLSRISVEKEEKELLKELTEEWSKRYQEGKITLQLELSSHRRTLEICEFIEFSEPRLEAVKPIHFTISDYNLQDPNNFNKNDLYARANALNELGTANVQENVFARIQVVQDQWINAKHNIDSANFSEAERQKMTDDYERLERYIRSFLGTELFPFG
ncbi:MAG: hypothetical protein ACOVSW_11395 [Candidatus Kapaibacteriota bacterium]